MSQAAIQAAWAALDADNYLVEMTQKLVRIPSVNPKFIDDPEQSREPEVQDVVEAELKAMGMTTERWDVFEGRPNVVGTSAGSEQNSLLLCGHIDVVPTGNPDDWTDPPFAANMVGNRMYGRGTGDMKAGLVAAMAAVRAIHKAGIELTNRVSIHSVVDEEAGGGGAMAAVAEGKLAKAAIITEPVGEKIMVCQGGLEWARVTIRGKGGHAGSRYREIWPQRVAAGDAPYAVNAIDHANRFMTALRDFESARCRARSHPNVPQGLNTINVGAIRGGAGMTKNGLPETMNNPAMIPDVAVIDLDLKFLPDERQEDVRAEFEEFVHNFCQLDFWLRDNPIKVEWNLAGLYFPPFDTAVDHPLVTSLQKRHAEVGGAGVTAGLNGVTDAGHYGIGGVPSVVFGPICGNVHGLDEWVDMDSVRTTTRTLIATIIDWCGTNASSDAS